MSTKIFIHRKPKRADLRAKEKPPEPAPEPRKWDARYEQEFRQLWELDRQQRAKERAERKKLNVKRKEIWKLHMYDVKWLHKNSERFDRWVDDLPVPDDMPTKHLNGIALYLRDINERKAGTRCMVCLTRLKSSKDEEVNDGRKRISMFLVMECADQADFTALGGTCYECMEKNKGHKLMQQAIDRFEILIEDELGNRPDVHTMLVLGSVHRVGIDRRHRKGDAFMSNLIETSKINND